MEFQNPSSFDLTSRHPFDLIPYLVFDGNPTKSTLEKCDTVFTDFENNENTLRQFKDLTYLRVKKGIDEIIRRSEGFLSKRFRDEVSSTFDARATVLKEQYGGHENNLQAEFDEIATEIRLKVREARNKLNELRLARKIHLKEVNDKIKLYEFDNRTGQAFEILQQHLPTLYNEFERM